MADSAFALKNLARIKKRIGALPLAAQKQLKVSMAREVDGLVIKIQAAMDAQYQGADEPHDHQRVRDSVHAYPNPKRAIGYFVLADAKDASGKFIGSNIEAGHRALDGTHVAARPAFYPTWRAQKKGIRTRVKNDAKAATRKAWKGIS